MHQCQMYYQIYSCYTTVLNCNALFTTLLLSITCKSKQLLITLDDLLTCWLLLSNQAGITIIFKLPKPSASQSGDKIYHDDLLHLPLVFLYQPFLGVKVHSHKETPRYSLKFEDHYKNSPNDVEKRSRVSLLTPIFCPFAFILVLERFPHLNQSSSLQNAPQLPVCFSLAPDHVHILAKHLKNTEV